MADADSLGIEVWRGSVNAWECDSNGHLNVRFYFHRALEGLVGLAAELGMPKAFSAKAGATLLMREQHVRFLREAHPWGRLHMRGAVLEMSETEARLLLAIYHTETGDPAATFIWRVAHVTAADARPFPWPTPARARAPGLTVELPAYAAPRTLDFAPPSGEASLEAAWVKGLTKIAQGAFRPQDCDVFGRMSAEQFVSRVSDGITQLTGRVREIIAEHAEGRPQRVGGAVLEYRVAHLDWPRAGDRLAIMSGLSAADGKTHRYVHWMLDPDTGRPWGMAASVAASLDLDARRIIPITDKALEALQAVKVENLSL